MNCLNYGSGEVRMWTCWSLDTYSYTSITYECPALRPHWMCLTPLVWFLISTWKVRFPLLHAQLVPPWVFTISVTTNHHWLFTQRNRNCINFYFSSSKLLSTTSCRPFLQITKRDTFFSFSLPSPGGIFSCELSLDSNGSSRFASSHLNPLLHPKESSYKTVCYCLPCTIPQRI